MRYDGKWYELPRQDGESVAAFLMRLLATAESRAETLSWLTSAGSMPGRPAPPRNDERADGLPPSRRGFQPARQPRATPVVAGRHTFHTACNTTRHDTSRVVPALPAGRRRLRGVGGSRSSRRRQWRRKACAARRSPAPRGQERMADGRRRRLAYDSSPTTGTIRVKLTLSESGSGTFFRPLSAHHRRFCRQG